MPRWVIVATALAVVAAILSYQVQLLRPLSVALTVMAGILFVIVFVSLLAPLFKKKDPYDLNALRKVHERADWAEVEEIQLDPDADVVCPNCGTVRGAVLPICPNCKSTCC